MVPTTELLLRCPDIRTQIDDQIVQGVLRHAPGVGDIDIDWHTGRIRVVTANQDHGVDIRQRLIGAGYPPIDEDREYMRESA